MPDEVAIWDGPAPGSEHWTHEEVALDSIPDAPGAVRNVVVPTLTSYRPAGSASRAVVVAPGGAFFLLSMDNEGHDVARSLAGRGLDAHVLKYRVVPAPADEHDFHTTLATAFASGIDDAIADTLPLAIADAERAVEVVRRAGTPHVTLLGFSAGARIAVDVATSSPLERRPDLVAAVYPPAPGATVVPGDVPPLFLATAEDDPIVGTVGTLRLHEMWRAADRPVELHLFERGGHGFGMLQRGLPVEQWTDLFVRWLDSHT